MQGLLGYVTGKPSGGQKPILDILRTPPKAATSFPPPCRGTRRPTRTGAKSLTA